jgi:hypothetical protein
MADEIDPRYGPQFQRGFDAAQHVATPTRTGPVRRADGPPPTAPRVADAPPIAERARVELPGEVELPEDAVLESDGPAASSRSRLEWAVLGLGVALILAAAALFWQSATDISMFVDSFFDPQRYASQLIRSSLTGPLLVGGVLTITAWLVMRASGAPTTDVRRYAVILGALSAALAVLALVSGGAFVELSAANQGYTGDIEGAEAQAYFRVAAFTEATRVLLPWVVFAVVGPGVAALALLSRSPRRDA